jgi:hypothetical protein
MKDKFVVKMKLEYKIDEFDNISYTREGVFVRYDSGSNKNSHGNNSHHSGSTMHANRGRQFLTILMNK